MELRLRMLTTCPKSDSYKVTDPEFNPDLYESKNFEINKTKDLWIQI